MRGSSWEYCSLISPPLLESFSTSLDHETKVSIQWPSITGSLQKSPGLTSCSSLFTPTVPRWIRLFVFKMHSLYTHKPPCLCMCFVVCLKQPSLFPSPLTKHIAAAHPVTSSRKPSLHPISSFFPAELHAYHLCSIYAPSALILTVGLLVFLLL